MQHTLARAISTACLILAPALAAGGDEPVLTLKAALDRARAVNPELAAFAFEIRAQEARSQQAGLRPAPHVELLLEDAVGSGPYAGLDSAQTTLSLSQNLELGGKRAGRTQLAEAQRARLRTEHAVQTLDVVAAIARRFVGVLAQQERVNTAREAVGLAARVQAAVDERVKAAASPEAERLRADAASAEANLALEDALHILETSRYELAAAMGLPEPDFSSVGGELFALQPSARFESLVARLEQAPDFLRFTDEARLYDAELRLAQAQRRADLRGSFGVRRFEQTGDTALVAGVSLPLFTSARAVPGVAVAQAESDRLPSSRQAALLKARAHLFAQYQEMVHAGHVLTTLQDQVLPQLAKALEQTEYAYRRGRYSYLEWSEAQRRLLEARTRRIDAAADFHTHRIEIERLTGESLSALPGENP
jgi:outer membrane protein, heavy metal efflux system